jgi:hypothetical protein
MANYQFKITPTMINATTEGSLDTSILNGVSIQRTGFIQVYNGTNKKMLELKDGDTFNDTIPTWASDSFVVAQ